MRVNKLDLNQVALLDALLSTRNVSHSAQMVHLSQPAVSAALARLRDYFDDPLLVPQGRNLVLTPFAKSLAEPVRDLMLQAQALTRRRPELDASRIERDITIVASDYVQHVLLAPLLRTAATEAPGLRFEVRSIGGYLDGELDQGDVDLVVSLASGVSNRHPSEIVFRDHFCCVVWSGNEVVKTHLTRSEMLDLGHVAVVLGRGRVATLDQLAFEGKGLKRRIEVKVPTFSILPAYIVDTNRIGTLQRTLADDLCKQWPLRLLRCPVPIPAIEIAVQWHRYQALDPAISWVRATLKAVAAGIKTSSGR